VDPFQVLAEVGISLVVEKHSRSAAGFRDCRVATARTPQTGPRREAAADSREAVIAHNPMANTYGLLDQGCSRAGMRAPQPQESYQIWQIAA